MAAVGPLPRALTFMRTILIVEDEFAIAEILAELLTEEGYRVALAHNGAEGLAQLEREGADIVLLDLMMPLMGGSEMLRRMRELPRTRSVPVVLMSAAPLALQELSAAELAPVLFLGKPFRFQALLDAIAALDHLADDGT